MSLLIPEKQIIYADYDKIPFIIDFIGNKKFPAENACFRETLRVSRCYAFAGDSAAYFR